MSRKLLLTALIALAAAAPASTQPQLLMPNVTYEKQVEFTNHGPVVIHVIRAPRPGGLYALRPVLSNGSIQGTQRVTQMQRDWASTATVAGVNGDLFSWDDGRPSGGLMRDRAIDHTPSPERSMIGIDLGGNIRVDRVSFFGTWQGNGQRRTLNWVNRPPGANAVTLYTPAWGPTTPSAPGSVEAVVAPLGPTVPNLELSGLVSQIAQGGGTPIPSNGAVLVARGTQAQKLVAEVPVGEPVRIRLILKPGWDEVVEALGGGPLLVREGKPVFRAYEAFSTDQLLLRHPRSAVGQRADGGIVLVAVDGRQAGYSVGMTTFELAQTLVRLGAVTASALDGGGSTTMAFEGQLLNRPSDPGGERPVSEALLVMYAGIYAPPPTTQVFSPNGDRTGERQELAYKVVRPSTVTATLRGPGGVVAHSETVARQPGVYTIPFTGKRNGGLAPEGRWVWTVSAVDDQARKSVAGRSFALNTTLGFLRAQGPALGVPREKPRTIAKVTLARAAAVSAFVESETGAVIHRFAGARREPGEVELKWDGRDANGNVAYPGRYVLRVFSANAFGRMELRTTFAVRQLPSKSSKPKRG